MTKRIVNRVLIAVAFGLLLPAAGWGGNQSSAKNNVPRFTRVFTADPEGTVRVNVVYRDPVGKRLAAARGHAGASTRVRKDYRNFPARSLTVAEAELPQLLQELYADPAVLDAEPDYVATVEAQTLPWGINRVDADVTLSYGQTGAGVKVGIIDTGIYSSNGTAGGVHVDLAANYAGGYDFVNNDANPWDDHGHGTHVAGTVAAVNNDKGVVGVAPEASVYALKACNAAGSCYYSDVADAIDWAITNGLHVLNLSIGGPDPDSTLQNACEAAFNAGITIVGASGNSGIGTVYYPAAYSFVIAVGATSSSNVRASFSNYGSDLDVVAPGVSIYSTVLGNAYASWNGTSMATPHVSGAAALLVAAGTTDPGQIRARLASTATDLGAAGRDNSYGYGLINVAAAVPIALPPLLAPLGGEVIPSGSLYTVDWDPFTNGVTYRVEYSLDNGAHWTLAVDGFGAPAEALTVDSLDWRVPSAARGSNPCLLAITGYNATGHSLGTLRSPVFTIEVLRLDNPRGAEVLASGQPFTIGWTLNEPVRPVAEFQLYASTNGGTTWTSLGSLAPEIREYLWTVPALNTRSGRCLILLKALDAAGSAVAVVKSPYFTVEVLRFENPVGGETLATGQDFLIRWGVNSTLKPVGSFTLYFSSTAGSSWQRIASVGAEVREYLWRAPVFGGNRTQCLFLLAANDALGKRMSSLKSPAFTVAVLSINAPLAGETLTSGTEYPIAWTANPTVRPVANIRVFFSRNKGVSWTVLATLPPTESTLLWTVQEETVLQPDRRLMVVLYDSLWRAVGAAKVTFAIQP